MTPYPFRRATAADLLAVQTLCEQAQADYWGTLKEHIEWTPELRAKLMEKTYPMTGWPQETDLSKYVHGLPVGLMILRFHGESMEILGWATARHLPREERIGVGLSGLLFGYEACRDAGATRAQGEVEETNDLILDTMKLAGARRKKGRPGFVAVEADINDAYRSGLEAALGAL